jgi:hypothetical protein
MTKGRATQRGNKSEQTRVSSFNDMKKKKSIKCKKQLF